MNRVLENRRSVEETIGISTERQYTVALSLRDQSFQSGTILERIVLESPPDGGATKRNRRFLSHVSSTAVHASALATDLSPGGDHE